MEFDPRILMFVVFGAGLTLAVTLERWLARYWLSLPILYVAVGFDSIQSTALSAISQGRSRG